jgi:4-hydroxybenzoyl-CoA thioesterase
MWSKLTNEFTINVEYAEEGRISLKNIYTVKVQFGDTDAAGIVFYPNFYRWMDQAAHDLIGNAILPVSQLQKEKNIMFPLLETFCKYHSPLHFEDVVEIHSEVSELRKKVFKVHHDFIKNGNVVASGYEVRAWTTIVDGKLKAVEIPEDAQVALSTDSTLRI